MSCAVAIALLGYGGMFLVCLVGARRQRKREREFWRIFKSEHPD